MTLIIRGYTFPDVSRIIYDIPQKHPVIFNLFNFFHLQTLVYEIYVLRNFRIL